jgi:hypothetical protein
LKPRRARAFLEQPRPEGEINDTDPVRLMRRRKIGNLEVADILEDFLEGRGDPLAWDGFTQGSSLNDLDNERLEQIRQRCARLDQEFPPDKPGEFCNEQGRHAIRSYVAELRSQSR